MTQTIFEIIARADAVADDPVRGPQIRMARYIVREKTFGGNIDKDHVLSVYKAHNEAVKRAMPPERLLVYDVERGLGPAVRISWCPRAGHGLPAHQFDRGIPDPHSQRLIAVKSDG